MIRPGTPDDAEAVARVQVRSWQAAYAHVLPAEALAGPSVERRAEQWRTWPPPLVAEVDGQIVGFVAVGAARDDDADGELYAIYVDPEHWGTGVGRGLIRAGERRLAELGYTDVVLWVLEDNPRARRFYEAAGWSHDGSRQPIDLFGVSLPEVRYRKRLREPA
jgi:ribosomal protein S18 acetylase RimI-like enzyme